MYSINDVIKMLKEYGKSQDFPYILNNSETDVIHKESGEFVCTVKEFTNKLRHEEHCDFEIVYRDNKAMVSVLRCKECGTVIFSRDAEYDAYLKCPTCGGYETYFKYYTQTEISSDSNKKREIQSYENLQIKMKQMQCRKKKRGLNDWEICRKRYMFNGCMYSFTLECLNLFNKNRTGLARLKGLNINVQKFEKNPKNQKYKNTRQWRIPLSPYAIYTQLIAPCQRVGKNRMKG